MSEATESTEEGEEASTPAAESALSDAAVAQIEAATKLMEEVAAFMLELSAKSMKPRMLQMKIDGIGYTNVKLPTSIGLELWPRLTALLGVAFTRVVATGNMDGVSGSMFVRVADRAMKDGLVPLVQDLLRNVQCGAICNDPKKQGELLPHFEEHFSGEYGHLLKVCAFVVSHNLRGPTYGAR